MEIYLHYNTREGLHLFTKGRATLLIDYKHVPLTGGFHMTLIRAKSTLLLQFLPPVTVYDKSIGGPGTPVNKQLLLCLLMYLPLLRHKVIGEEKSD